MNKGKLIVIEGVDASGKQTQTELLYKYILNTGKKVIKIEFPDYESPSSEVIKMYLNGDFGKDANAVNPYAASAFFAIDRFVSFKTKWEKLYNEGYIVIADRYVTANMLYQASKIENEKEKSDFIDWICDFEYAKFALPKPDLSLFLDVTPDISFRLMQSRKNKYSGEDNLDIHESNKNYLYKTYENAKFVSQKCGFKVINCVDGDNIKTIEEIHKSITDAVKDYIL